MFKVMVIVVRVINIIIKAQYRRLDANTLYAAATLFSHPSLHRDHYRGSLILQLHGNNKTGANVFEKQ